MNYYKTIFLSFLVLGFTAQAMEQHDNIINAARAGDMQAVQAFLDAGADVNQADRYSFSYGWTALMIAAQKGCQTICELLIAKGADVNQADGQGWTALMWAALQGRQQICELLIANGANINQADNDGKTVLMYVARLLQMANNHQPTCELLINRMLKIPSDAQRDKLYTFLMCMQKSGFDWVVINQCKPHLLNVIEEENETEPKGSVALQEIEKIESKNIKQALIKKYWPNK